MFASNDSLNAWITAMPFILRVKSHFQRVISICFLLQEMLKGSWSGWLRKRNISFLLLLLFPLSLFHLHPLFLLFLLCPSSFLWLQLVYLKFLSSFAHSLRDLLNLSVNGFLLHSWSILSYYHEILITSWIFSVCKLLICTCHITTLPPTLLLNQCFILQQMVFYS